MIEVPDNEFLVSKTDPKGIITYANTTFIKISGYTEEELVGKPHNIVRHPDMPRTIFKLLWDTITQGKEFWGYVKNRAKNGDYYWVFAHVTPSYDETGKIIIGYQSDRRKPRREAVEKAEALYRKILEAEKIGGMQAGERFLKQILDENKTIYEEFVWML